MWNSILSTEIAIGKPTAFGLWTKVKENFDYLYGVAGGSGGGLANGSFEIDADNDGLPDNWTVSLYPGGSFSLDIISPVHGAKIAKFVHPGGAGNGGGYLQSGYFEVSPLICYGLAFTYWCSAAGIKTIVQVRFYDAAKVELGAGSPAVLRTSTSNPTSATTYTYSFFPPTAARYAKVGLVGGYTDTAVAGNIFFEDVRQTPQTWIARPTDSIHKSDGTERSSTDTLYTKMSELLVEYGGIWRVKFNLKSSVGAGVYGRIYKNGTAIGVERSTTSLSYVTYSEDIATTWVPGDLCQLYCKASLSDTLFENGFILAGAPA